MLQRAEIREALGSFLAQEDTHKVLYKIDTIDGLDLNKVKELHGVQPHLKSYNGETGEGTIFWPGSDATGNATGLYDGQGFVPNGTFSTMLPHPVGHKVTGQWISVKQAAEVGASHADATLVEEAKMMKFVYDVASELGIEKPAADIVEKEMNEGAAMAHTVFRKVCA